MARRSTMLSADGSKNFLVQLGKTGVLWFLLYMFGYWQWDPRWLVLAVGFAFTFYVWRQQKKAAAGETADSKEGAHGGDLPAWVLNPDTQRAEWTNIIFRQLWPHLEEFLRRTLHSVEEDAQLQERLTGYHIKSLRFPTVSLGSIPPKVGGVNVHKSVHRDEIVLDLNVRYDGDLHIGMEVVVAGMPALVPPASASISNMSFTGFLRVHLRPLLKDLPFVGGVTVSFLQPPIIDFDLGGIANALDLPGISHLLRHVIQDQLEQTIVMPNSVSMSLVNLESRGGASGNSELRFFQQQSEPSGAAMPSGVLSVHLVEAKGLVNKDRAVLMQGKSDPYAKVRILADGVVHTFKSDVVPNNLDPVWKLLIDMPVDNPESLDDLAVEVWDEDVGNRDDFLGRCTIPLSVSRTAMTTGLTQDVWKELEGVKRGSFHAEVSWSELKLTRPAGDFRHDDNHKGVLVVVVDSCNNLMGGRTGLKLPNPAVRVELCGISQQTAAVVGSVNPVFSHRMSFLVRDPTCDTLKITVVDDKRSSGSLGSLRIDLSDLLEQSFMTQTNHVFTLATPRGTAAKARGDKSPVIVLSLTFRYICRPKTSSFGAHSSLHELSKIMQTTVNTNGLTKNGTFMNGEAFGSRGALANEAKSFPYIDDTSSASTPALGQVRRLQIIEVNGGNRNRVAETAKSNSKLETPEPVRKKTLVRTTDNTPAVASATLPTIHPTDLRPRIHLSLKYSKPMMTLSVVVHSLFNLRGAISSPYVKLYLIESVGVMLNRRVPNSKRKTKSLRKTVFEETLLYFLPPSHLKSVRLEVSVCCDRGMLGRNNAIGRCLVGLSKVHVAIDKGKQAEATITDWHTLHVEEDVERGMPKSLTSSGKLSRKTVIRSSSRTSLPGA